MATAKEPSGSTKTSRYRSRNKALRLESEDWRGHWSELAEFMLPRKGKYLSGNMEDSKPGEKKNSSIINSTASEAVRTLAAGMQGGMTSPSRPWFQLALGDRDLMEFAPVRDWLHQVREMMLNVMSRSNFYGSIHAQYAELGVFGTAAMNIEADEETVIRCRPFTIGEYRLVLDSKYRPTTMYRQFSMSAEQMVSEFGKDNVSAVIKRNAQTPALQDARSEVIHVMEPKAIADAMGRTYDSVYFELSAPGDKFLRQGGYLTKPFVATRWDVTGVNTYGDSPGMIALGDTKMLQLIEEKKLKAIDKQVDPPMNAPLAMKGQGPTIVSGGVNFLDVTAGSQSFTPAYQVNMDIGAASAETERVENRINRVFFRDLFLAILTTGKAMTATEVVERHEEKLLMLGPVIERLEAEQLDVVIERVYNIMDRRGMLPPVPPELSGKELEIKYISLLSQAQRLVGVSAIERTAIFVTGLAEAYPTVLDKFDADQAVDEFSRAVGVTPNLINSDEKVAEKREADAKAQQAQQALEMAVQMAESGKTLSETPLNTGSALDAVTEQEGAS